MVFFPWLRSTRIRNIVTTIGIILANTMYMTWYKNTGTSNIGFLSLVVILKGNFYAKTLIEG